MSRWALIALACAGCDRRTPIASCAQDLGGEYEAGDRRWMVIDQGPRLEVYPLFPDVPAGPLEVAPRMLELRRDIDGTLRGETRRRYMQGSTSCLAKVPARITRCVADALEVVHGETAAPLGVTPCQWGRSEPARVERWIHR